MKKIIFPIALLAFFISSCSETEIATPIESQSSLPAENPQNDLSEQHVGKITEKNLDNLHSKTITFSEILTKMYANEDVFNQVNSFIETGYYSDESIVLQDLLSDKQSQFQQKLRLSNNFFKEAFNQEIRKLKTNGNLRQSGNDLEDYLISNGISIYFPYSVNFKNKKLKEITIVMPPKEDVNEAEGIKLTKCGKNICEEKVRVNDEYAKKNPTHIIYAGGANVKQTYSQKMKNGRINAINTIYFGKIRCKKQYDALISFTGNGGGSEIKIFRGSGYLSYDTNNQITNITGDIVSESISRSDINNNNTIQVTSIWDTDWKTDNFEQVLGIYEEDTKGEISFTGTVNTTIKVNGQNQTGSLSYNIKRTSQDEIIRNWKINRAAYMVINSQDQGYGLDYGGTLSGGPWAIYDGYLHNSIGANVSFTLPNKLF